MQNTRRNLEQAFDTWRQKLSPFILQSLSYEHLFDTPWKELSQNWKTTIGAVLEARSEEFDGVLQFHYQLGCAIPWGHSMDQEVRYQHLWRSLEAEGGDEELGSSRQRESCDKALRQSSRVDERELEDALSVGDPVYRAYDQLVVTRLLKINSQSHWLFKHQFFCMLC